eukprot:m.160661 g.160661  ORF g.160661 m.160661 type:complete len:92 (+) comp17629_c0_seq3:1714-1989(+)
MTMPTTLTTLTQATISSRKPPLAADENGAAVKQQSRRAAHATEIEKAARCRRRNNCPIPTTENQKPKPETLADTLECGHAYCRIIRLLQID